MLDYVGFDPASEGTREALLAVGNGYFATRGAWPETRADDVHYPGVYVAGLYNRLVSEVDGHPREDESVVNLPNWLPLTFRPDGGDWLEPGSVEVVHLHRALHLRQGVLTRELVVSDRAGRSTRLRQRTLVSMAAPHRAALETTITPLDWSGRLYVRSGLDAGIANSNVAEFRGLAARHLTSVETGVAGPDSVWLTAQTSQSGVLVAQCARTTARRGATPLADEWRTRTAGSSASMEISVGVVLGEENTVDKSVSLFTARDVATSEPLLAARQELADGATFGDLLAAHVDAWQQLWRRFYFRLADGTDKQRAVNVDVFHLLQTLSPHTCELDVGVPARGLHGEGYRGHVFWDELFVLPLLDLRLPELSKSLLRYRHRRLPQARRRAAELGARGALFPWQSGSDGREETPKALFNPLSGHWIADNSHRQYHVNLAIAYNVWHHWESTGDLDFLAAYGAEMLIEIARFWASIARYDDAVDRYDICRVIGSEQFHDGYPNRLGEGIDNSAYVNIITAWALIRAIDAHRILGQRHRAALWERLAVTEEELTGWEHLSRRLRLPFLRKG